MGKATALARLAAGDHVVVIGSSEAKGLALTEQAATERFTFLRADLSSMSETRGVLDEITARYDAVDALGLFANRINPKRRETPEGLESTFALYYLSRYVLSFGLSTLLDAADTPVIINVAGVGKTAGEIEWDDPQLTRRYGRVKAQLQAGRANDLLGVAFAERANSKARYVLYHPGFTRSGVTNLPNPVMRAMLAGLGRLFARPVADAVAPVIEWMERPPSAPLSAIDKESPVDLSLKTLDPKDAARLADYTEKLLAGL
ncbi:short-chain dehydrogenase [Prauserella marina]|nr:short-chain dehydrogenase [Prauserella marina]